MNRLFAVPLGVLALAAVTALETTSMFHHVRADPCAMLLAFLAFRFDMLGAALTALMLGAVVDVSSGAPLGLHMLSLTVLLVVMRAVANALQMEPGIRLLPMAVGAALLHAVVVAVVVEMFTRGRIGLAGVWQSGLPSVAFNAALGLVLIPVADAVARRVWPEPDHMFLP